MGAYDFGTRQTDFAVLMDMANYVSEILSLI